MGRHYKGPCRNPITIPNRPVWPPELPKSTSGILSAIQIAVIIGSFISFLLCVWNFPQEDSEYPDGFNVQCPATSYNILDNRNITIKCKECPECPPGQGLTPPCNSTIFIDTPIKCKMCVSSETFSDKHSSGGCQPCQVCGLRDTISPCTPHKNTQCGDCQRGHYPADLTMDSCTKCSSCCRRRSYAELQCIYLKQCNRSNCVQQMENKHKHALTWRNIIQIFTTPGKVKHEKIMENRSILQGRNFSKDGNLNKEGNMVSEDIMFQEEKVRFKRDDGAKVEEANNRSQAKDSNPIATTKATPNANKEEARRSPPTRSNLEENVATAPESNVVETTMPSTSSYSGGVTKLLNTLIALVVFAIVVLTFIAIVVTCMCCKKTPPEGQTQGQRWANPWYILCCAKYEKESEESLPVLYDSTSQSEFDFYEISHNSNNMAGNTPFEKSANMGNLESLSLSDMSQDLEDVLVKKLDVRRNGERLCGWQKVGTEFGIERDDLRYLENAYKKDGGSPTKELLDILGCQGRNAADLVDVLRSPNVNCPDIALLIQQCMKY